MTRLRTDKSDNVAENTKVTKHILFEFFFVVFFFFKETLITSTEQKPEYGLIFRTLEIKKNFAIVTWNPRSNILLNRNPTKRVFVRSRPDPPNRGGYFGMQISVNRLYDRRPNDLYGTL